MTYRDSADLLEQARALLEDDELEEAIALGEELEARGEVRGAEVIALAYQEAEETAKGVAAMERGVKLEPTAWWAWQLLGNLRSQCHDYPGALEAYAQARACPEPWVTSLDYNEGVALVRAKEYERGFALLARVEGELYLKAQARYLGALNGLERYGEVLKLVETVLARRFEGEVGEDLSDTCFEKAIALWKCGEEDQAVECVWQALYYDKLNKRAMWLLRELTAESSPDAKLYRVMVEGDWHEVPEGYDEPPGFFTTYHVVAEDPEEALYLLSPFEPEELRESLRVEECEELEAWPGEPKGVYEASPYQLFPADSGEEDEGASV